MKNANDDYIKAFKKQNYDSFNLMLPKGSRPILKAAADRRGLSVNSWISAAIAAALDKDGQTLPVPRSAADPAPAPSEDPARKASEDPDDL